MPRFFAALFFMDAECPAVVQRIGTSVDSLESSECLLSWMSTNVSLVYWPAICVSNNLHHLTILSFYPLIHIDPTFHQPSIGLIMDFSLGPVRQSDVCRKRRDGKLGPWDLGDGLGWGFERSWSFETFDRNRSMGWLVSKSHGPAFRQPKWQQWIVPVGVLWGAVGVMGAMVLSIGNSDIRIPCAMTPGCHGQSSCS